MYVIKVTYPKPFSPDEMLLLDLAVNATVKDLSNYREFDGLTSLAHRYLEDTTTGEQPVLEIIPESKLKRVPRKLARRVGILLAQNLFTQSALVAMVQDVAAEEMERYVGPIETVNYTIVLDRVSM